MTPEEEANRRERIKHRMEIIRTMCAVIALCLNTAVMTHVMGLWQKEKGCDRSPFYLVRSLTTCRLPSAKPTELRQLLL